MNTGKILRSIYGQSLDHVFHIAEIPAGLAVAVDGYRFVAQQPGEPLGDHRSISAVGVLARTEDVEIAQENST